MVRLKYLITHSKLCDAVFKKFTNAYLKSKFGLSILDIETFYQNGTHKICEFTLDDIDFKFIDLKESNTISIVKTELECAKIYDFKNIDFKKEDCVIDIGANIGMISIYLAKKFPFIKIYAYEPVLQNYQNLLTNIRLNNIPDGIIIPHHAAVTKDGRIIDMSINVHNLGGSSISDVISVGETVQSYNTGIKSVTLESIFKQYHIEQLKLLKIDCEGSEYEILQNVPIETLNRINILRGEFHENKKLTDEYDIDSLMNYSKKYIKDIKIEPARECFIM